MERDDGWLKTKTFCNSCILVLKGVAAGVILDWPRDDMHAVDIVS